MGDHPTDSATEDYIAYVSARLPTLYRTAYLLCGDVHLADDLVQTTITALFVNWARASRAGNLDAYVHRVMVRKLVDEKRRGWARVFLMRSPPEPRRPTPPPPEPAADRDVVDALRLLPRGQRTVLVLRYFCDLSIEQVATTLGCSIGNVKSQTARALAAIRPLLDKRRERPAVSSPGCKGANP
jgi:RNA polymerase sigma-70 factor (sigma-E family)